MTSPQLQVLEFAEREARRRLDAAQHKHDAAAATLDAAAATHARVWNLQQQPPDDEANAEAADDSRVEQAEQQEEGHQGEKPPIPDSRGSSTACVEHVIGRAEDAGGSTSGDGSGRSISSPGVGLPYSQVYHGRVMPFWIGHPSTAACAIRMFADLPLRGRGRSMDH